MKGTTVRRRVMGEAPPPRVAPAGWGYWTSPNGVDHLIAATGACATCGRDHPDAEVAWND